MKETPDHGTLHFKGKHAKPFENKKVGSKVSMTVHGIVDSHEMQPDYTDSPHLTNEVSDNAYPDKKKPKHVLHTRVKIIRTEPPTSPGTPLSSVVGS